MKKLVIFGASDMARLVAYFFEHDSDYQVEAFTVDREYCTSSDFLDRPLIPFDEVRERFPPNEFSMFVAAGYAQMSRIRERKYNEARDKGYTLVSYVSSRCSYLSQHEPGDNCLILEDNTIQPYVRIGNNVFIWSGNHIGHDGVIEDHVYIASHAVISGFCTIGHNSFLGVNCTFREGLKIAPYSVIGAGAVIMKDTVEKGVYLPPRATLYEKNSDEIKL